MELIDISEKATGLLRIFLTKEAAGFMFMRQGWRGWEREQGGVVVILYEMCPEETIGEHSIDPIVHLAIL
jgi:hypothetical protein